jgi:hypothetical protein
MVQRFLSLHLLFWPATIVILIVAAPKIKVNEEKELTRSPTDGWHHILMVVSLRDLLDHQMWRYAHAIHPVPTSLFIFFVILDQLKFLSIFLLLCDVGPEQRNELKISREQVHECTNLFLYIYNFLANNK